MITIEMMGEHLQVRNGSRILDDCGNLISELNTWLNNGFKLISIEDGAYKLEEDKDQLCFIKYENNEDGYYFYKVVTHATSWCFRMYFNQDLEMVYFSNEDTDDKVNICLCSAEIAVLDLRGKSKDEVQYYSQLEKGSTLFIEDAIFEDLSNY